MKKTATEQPSVDGNATHSDRKDVLRKSLLKIRNLQERLDASEASKHAPIAIVGMACRFPGGADNPRAFWDLLCRGDDAVRDVPPERWPTDRYYDPNQDAIGKTYTNMGGFLDDVESFDPLFFGISPREAETLDPQQRLLLEVAWEALEDAGIPPDSLSGVPMGVFVGMTGSDYLNMLMRADAMHDTYAGSGVSRAIAAGRLSYVFGLSGPSVCIDTACSSSLVAIHDACQSLRLGDCDSAMAGGVQLILSPDGHILASQGQMLSPAGRCKTFDATADGYARAEGCALVVLKRLHDAESNGDNILGIIRGTAINQDGHSAGITAPSGRAQEAVIRDALADAKINAHEISYVETHGTGTVLGDPIEVQALGAVHGSDRDFDKPLLIGSVKTNIGHTESAAGIAGLVKTVMAMQHGEIPPHLHLTELNPHIPWEDLPIKVSGSSVTPWPAWAKRRLSGLSSFGFSGTNVHMIIESGTSSPCQDAQVERPIHLLALSAKNDAALSVLATSYGKLLQANSDVTLADLCHSANAGRSHHECRMAVLGSSKQQMVKHLSEGLNSGGDNVHKGKVLLNRKPRVTFLFTGQGSQYIGMGRELFDTNSTFRDSLIQCDEILRDHLDESLLSVLYPQPDFKDRAEALIHQTGFTQPAMFALGWALATLWKSWGVTPTAVIGHSVGELVAACVAGVFSLADGLALIAARGRLMQELPQGGAMAVVFAAEKAVLSAVDKYSATVSIAGLNGPENTLVSGKADDVKAMLGELEKSNIDSQYLQVSHAFHSPLMDPVMQNFEAEASKISYRSAQLDIISSVSGRVASVQEMSNAAYWRDQIRRPVRFAEAIQEVRTQGSDVFVEIGPSSTLLGMGLQCVSVEDESLWLPSLSKDGDDWSRILTSMAALYARGLDIDWHGFDKDYLLRQVDVPTYPFQRQSYPVSNLNFGNTQSLRITDGSASLHPLVGRRIRSALPEHMFESVIDVNALEYLNDHRFYGVPVFPAAAFVEIALVAAGLAGMQSAEIESLDFLQALTLSADQASVVQVIIGSEQSGSSVFKICSLLSVDENEDWVIHATGKLQQSSERDCQAIDLDEIRNSCADEVSVNSFYADGKEIGVDYGPTFRGIQNAWRGDGEAFARVELHPELTNQGNYLLHPTLLDSGFQVMGIALNSESKDTLYMPVGIGTQRVLAKLTGDMIVHASVSESGADSFSGDIRIINTDGTVVAETLGLRFKQVNRKLLEPRQGESIENWLHHVDWQASPLELEVVDYAGHWVIFADNSVLGSELGDWIKDRGGICTTVTKHDAYERKNDRDIGIRASNRDDMARLLEEVSNNGEDTVRGFIYLWALESEVHNDTPLSDLIGDAKAVGAGALNLASVMADGVVGGSSRLWLVTRGARVVGAQTELNELNQAALWGLGAVIATEQPDFRCVRIDLDPGREKSVDLVNLAQEIQASGDEYQIAFRGNARYVARFLQDGGEKTSLLAPGREERFQLDIAERGLLESLEYVPLTLGLPEFGEVEVEVVAAGLNFRDVLNALGTYSGKPGPLGNEFAGCVTAIGSDVMHLAIGDSVVGLASNTFSSHVICDARFVVRVPDGLSAAEVATVPLAFLTSDYALRHCAKIEKGQKILIHAAAGGVGMAAVQIAKRAGAEIFATAGSVRKREFLRQLGVEHVFDSRSLDFADEISELTNGKGLDVVLNSLNGEFIERSLSVLAQGGRFMEIGMAGIWTPEEVAAHRPDILYDIIFLGESLEKEPDLIRESFSELLSLMQLGELQPLPRHDFPMSNVVEAFRFMAAARHIGKVVVHRARNDHGGIAPVGSVDVPLRQNATYIITGGLGGIGFEVARWLAANGAGSLVLIGRNLPTGETTESIEDLKREGVQVCVEALDIADEDGVNRMIAKVSESMPTLRGVVHCAGVLDDGVLARQTWERFETVMAPKVAGAWNLHRATTGINLDFFVLFSSIASVFGAASQANYAAANSFMDALAEFRRTQLLPALSLNWGAWSGTGMVERLGELGENRKSKYGIGTIALDKGLKLFGSLLSRDCAQVSIVPIDWSVFFDALGDENPPFFSELATTNNSTSELSISAISIKEQVIATPVDQRAMLVETFVREQVSGVLSLDSTKLDPHQGLAEVGMDSLMAVEIRNSLQAALKTTLPSTVTLEYPTIATLASYVGTEILGVGVDENPEEDEKGKSTRQAEISAQVESLSDDEAHSSLLDELEKAGY